MIINFRFRFPVVESKILLNKVKSSLGQEIYLNIRTSHRSSLHDHVANAGRFQVQDQHLPKIKQIYMYYYIFQEKNVIFFVFLPDPQLQGHVEQTFQDLKKRDIINFRFRQN